MTQDYFGEILGAHLGPRPTRTRQPRIFHEHLKELEQGSGLLPSTIIRANVFSTQDPKQKAYILSRCYQEGDNNSAVRSYTDSRRGMLCYPNPLFPDEMHNKMEMGANDLGKPTYAYRAAFGSCKPPLVWAPQAKITEYNRGWLTEKYGKQTVDEMDERLTRFQEFEKRKTVEFLAKKLSERGFTPDRAKQLGQTLFNASGLSRNYDAMTDTNIPVEITEGQKKVYCMAQGRENMMLGQALGLIEAATPAKADAEITAAWRTTEWVEPCLFVCTPGVWNIAQKNPDPDHKDRHILNDSWRFVLDLTGREVHMTWDADAETNLDVAQAGSCTGEAMQKVYPGVKIQWRLYDKEKKILNDKGLPIKIGADDFIKEFGPEQFFAMPARTIAIGLERSFIEKEADSRGIGYLRFLQVLAVERPHLARLDEVKDPVKKTEPVQDNKEPESALSLP